MRISKLFLSAALGVLIFQDNALRAQTQTQQQPIGQFDNHEDVGNPRISGSAAYNPTDQTYLLSGAGKNIWTNNDQFQFVWKKIKGDFIIKATVRFLGDGVDGHRKIGIMARDKLTADSRYADGSVHGGPPLLTALQSRCGWRYHRADHLVFLSSYRDRV